jgi:hypothetical protein
MLSIHVLPIAFNQSKTPSVGTMPPVKLLAAHDLALEIFRKLLKQKPEQGSS